MKRATLQQHAEVIRNAADKCGYIASGFIVMCIIPRADATQNPVAFECLMILAGYEVEAFNDVYLISLLNHVSKAT